MTYFILEKERMKGKEMFIEQADSTSQGNGKTKDWPY